MAGEARPGNQIAVAGTFAGIGIAQALNLGQEVGPKLNFSSAIRHTFEFGEVMSIGSGPRSGQGEFYNQRNKFIALKVNLNGSTHYGWARLSTKLDGNKLAFELVDYAYQDRPNLPILAGQGIPKPNDGSVESDSTDTAVLVPNRPLTEQPERQRSPGTLGMLAQGSDALRAWRR